MHIDAKLLRKGLSNWNKKIYEKDNTSWPSEVITEIQGWFNIWKASYCAIYNINKLKKKNIISTV